MRRSAVPAVLVVLAVSGAARAQEPPIALVASHVFKMVDDTVPPIFPGKRKFVWKVRRASNPIENEVVLPDPGGPGDPTIHGATLTVYNAAGSGEVYTVDLPAEEWYRTGSGDTPPRWIYAAGSPIWRVKLKAPAITVQGGKAEWGYSLDEPSQGLLAVRLTLGSAITWCGVPRAETRGNPPSSERFDRRDLYRAERRGAPPDACPPLPTAP